MQNSKDFIMMIVAVVLVLGTIFVHSKRQQNDFEAVKNSEKTLKCNFRDASRVVNPDLIIKRNSSEWVFVNGSSSTCTVINTPFSEY